MPILESIEKMKRITEMLNERNAERKRLRTEFPYWRFDEEKIRAFDDETKRRLSVLQSEPPWPW